jgi:Mg/Co/Ni transporter MgtE
MTKENNVEYLSEKGSWTHTAFVRFVWLSGLLLLQSISGFILEAHEELIRKHIVITLFLTMLVGAGGNAGAQAAVSVIRGLALKKIKRENIWNVLFGEFVIGCMLSTSLFLVGFVRVCLTRGGFWEPQALKEALAIGLALYLIVLLSVTIGAGLPLLFHFVIKIDPAHSGSTVQVIMDVVGVMTTVTIAGAMLASVAE